MKKSSFLVLALVTTFAMPMLALADVTGKWNTEKSEDGAWLTVDIQPCDNYICGVVVDAHNVKDNSVIGTEMIKGMKKKSDTAYSKGKIYAPDTEKWYKSKMKLDADGNLKVSGCVFGGIICRSQLWTRAR